MSDDISNELEKTTPTRDASIDFTHRFRDVLETFCDAGEEAAKFLKESQEIDYWRGAGYDSWKDWYETEYEEQISFLRELKLSLDARTDIVQALSQGGLTNRQISETLGVHRNTVTNLLKRADDPAQPCASTEVDAAGQSVEEVGHIDEHEPVLQDDAADQRTVINFPLKPAEEIMQPDPFVDRFAGIDFDAMVISTTPVQIIQTQASDDTPDYFVPRQPVPSWSPPQVAPLPPASPKAYDVQSDNSPEFLEPPMKLQKAGEANKTPEDKHCRTCACNLLP